MSRSPRPDETRTSVSPRRLTPARGTNRFVVGGSRERQDRRGSRDAKEQDGKMNRSSKKDLERCLWRRSKHHLRIPSKAEAMFSYSSSIARHFKPAASAARLFRDADRSSSASTSSSRLPKRQPGLALKSEFVTSVANEVRRKNDDVGLASSMTQNPRCEKVFESRTRRQKERTEMVGRKEMILEPSERQTRRTIDMEKEETVDKGKRSEEQRQMWCSEAKNDENNKAKTNISYVLVKSKEESKQWNEAESREEKQKEELSSCVQESYDAVNDFAPEDECSRTTIGEDLASAIRDINQAEPSGTVTMELQRPAQQNQDSDIPQNPLGKTFSHDWIQKTEEESDITSRCPEKQLQQVDLTMSGQIRCARVHKVVESFKAESDDDERIRENERETTTEPKKSNAGAAACRLLSSFFTPRSHFPRSSVRSAEPRIRSPSISTSRSHNNCSASKVTNELISGHGVRVRDVIVGDSKIRLISRSNHPQPNRASILRQVAAASSSASTSSYALSSSTSRSAVAAPAAMFHRNSTIAKNFSTALILIQGPFTNDHRSKNNQPNRVVRNSPVRATSAKASRTKYQKTRTFLVNVTRSVTPEVSPKRRSISSAPKRTRPLTPAEPVVKTTQGEHPTGQKPKRTFFVQGYRSRQNLITSGDVAHRHLNHPLLLQQRKSATVHRTATRTLVSRFQKRNS